MASSKLNLIIGIGGHAVALDPATGTELWRTKLKASQLVTVKQLSGKVYAGAGGELFCLDQSTGNILWRNPLKGLGLNILAFAGDSDLVAAAAAAAAAAS